MVPSNFLFSENIITDETDTISCILSNFADCEIMIADGAAQKPVEAFLKIMIECYGKDRILAVIYDFGPQYKKYIPILEVLSNAK